MSYDDLIDLLNEVEMKLKAIKNLTIKWRKELEEYPDSEEGRWCGVTVELCAREIEKILSLLEDESNE